MRLGGMRLPKASTKPYFSRNDDDEVVVVLVVVERGDAGDRMNEAEPEEEGEEDHVEDVDQMGTTAVCRRT